MSRELSKQDGQEGSGAAAGGGDGVSCDVGSCSCAPSFCLSRQEGPNLLYKGFFLKKYSSRVAFCLILAT